MESMCRICCSENVPMESVVTIELQEIYQKLTFLPFQSESPRPLLVCYMCLVYLRKAHKLMVSSLLAEHCFSQMLETNIVPNRMEHRDSIPKLTHEVIEQVNISPYEGEYNMENSLEYDINCVKQEISRDDSQMSLEDRQDWTSLKAFKVETVTVEVKPEDINIEDNGICASDASSIKLEIDGQEDVNNHVATRTYRYNPASDFTIHKRYITTPVEKPFKCDTCQKLFKKRNHLKRHFIIHTNEKPYKCEMCQRGFTDNSNLKKHFRSHTGEKRFKCEVCQRTFRDAGNLKIHMHTHTGEKPFQCHICPRTFTQSFSLVKHIRTHTGEKPFKCDTCLMPFRNMCHLKRHILTHTGEKPYKCEICQRSFTRNYNLQAHNRTHHPSVDPKNTSATESLDSVIDPIQIDENLFMESEFN